MINMIRSIIFAILMFSTVIFFSTICLVTIVLPYRVRYPLVTAWPRLTIWLAKHLCGIKYIIHGKENIPSNQAIIVSNHQSTWETLAFLTIFPHNCFVLKKELLQIPFFGWCLSLLNPIGVDRKKSINALDQVIAQGAQRLAENHLITIFPEGSRMSVKQLGKFKIGAAKLAMHTQAPIIPVSHDAGKYWSRRAFVKKPGTIHVTIGKPILPTGNSAAKLMNTVKEKITQQLDGTPT